MRLPDLTQPLWVTTFACAARSFYSLNLLLYSFNVINLLCSIYSNQSYFFCLLWQLICKVCEAARFCRSPLIRLFSVICIFRLHLGSCLVFGEFFTSYYHLLYCFHLFNLTFPAPILTLAYKVVWLNIQGHWSVTPLTP